MGLQYYHINTLPRLRQIVWCRLPEGADLKPGSTVRPVLVRASKRHTETGRGALLVAYGTTRLDTGNRGSIDLIIQNVERLTTLDLPHAVRFDLGRENWLPWAAEFFSPPEHNPYVVAGDLNDREIVRLRRCLKRRGIITAL